MAYWTKNYSILVYETFWEKSWKESSGFEMKNKEIKDYVKENQIVTLWCYEINRIFSENISFVRRWKNVKVFYYKYIYVCRCPLINK